MSLSLDFRHYFNMLYHHYLWWFVIFLSDRSINRILEYLLIWTINYAFLYSCLADLFYAYCFSIFLLDNSIRICLVSLRRYCMKCICFCWTCVTAIYMIYIYIYIYIYCSEWQQTGRWRVSRKHSVYRKTMKLCSGHEDIVMRKLPMTKWILLVDRGLTDEISKHLELINRMRWWASMPWLHANNEVCTPIVIKKLRN